MHIEVHPDATKTISRELSLMKSMAFLINTSRGPVVDQEALVRALQMNKEKRLLISLIRKYWGVNE